jgi:hypothetical protein
MYGDQDLSTGDEIPRHDDNQVNLSHVLHLPEGDARRIHETCIQRLSILIKSDPARSKERMYMQAWAQHLNQLVPTTTLLCVEYAIDDGSMLQGGGDMLFYDSAQKSIIVVEAKRLAWYHGASLSARRSHAVDIQAIRGAAYIASWLNHIRSLSLLFGRPSARNKWPNFLHAASAVHAATLTCAEETSSDDDASWINLDDDDDDDDDESTTTTATTTTKAITNPTEQTLHWKNMTYTVRHKYDLMDAFCAPLAHCADH